MNRKLFLTSLTTLVTLLAGIVLAAAQGPTPLSRVGPDQNPQHALEADPRVLDAFDELRTYAAGLPIDVLPDTGLIDLRDMLDEARRAYAQDEPCQAADIMQGHFDQLEGSRYEPFVAWAEDLSNRIRLLRTNILAALPSGVTCSGHERVNMPLEIKINESNNRRFRATIQFGEPRLWSVKVGDDDYTQLEIPGIEIDAGEPGKPGVPVLRRLIAVPTGADVSIAATFPMTDELALKLYPFQPQAVDQVEPDPDLEDPLPPEFFDDPPFVKDESTYATDTAFPQDVCVVTPLGQMRDLSIAQIACAAGQYNPVAEALTLFETLTIDVSFDGGDGTFLTRAALNPFESAIDLYVDATLNGQQVYNYIDDFLPPQLCIGEEYLILTHPDFRPAADNLAAHKNAKGILTRVFEVNDGAGAGPDTREEIDAFIEERYYDCLVRPSYIMLLGDAEFIAPFYFTYEKDGTTRYIGTDYPYAVLTANELPFAILPSFAVGRVPVDTLDQANTVVNKIIGYESNPPALSSFYNNATFAAQFQCCRMNDEGSPLNGLHGRTQRGYIETAELVRDRLLAEGYQVERIYTRTVKDDYTGNPTPRRYYNGALLPADLGPGSGFPWNQTSQDLTPDIIDAFNAGRFLVLHRDHGSKNRWINPEFHKSDIADLDNGELLPVVFSVNCTTGYFDNETNPNLSDDSPQKTYSFFVERLLRESNGGAVGVLGDTRASPTWENNALTRGFFDAIWPDTVSYGGNTSQRRLGDVLNHSKLYLFFQIDVAQSAGNIGYNRVVRELFMWHAYGDPTLEIWTENPNIDSLSLTVNVEPDDDGIIVQYGVEGATLTALQGADEGLVPIGRAVVEGGQAHITYVKTPQPGTHIQLYASKDNFVSVALGAVPVSDSVNIYLPFVVKE